MPVNRIPFRFPAYGRGFLGEQNREGETDEIFQAGALVRCRNFEIIGRGRLLKRKGDLRYDSTAITSAATQGLAMWNFDRTRKLLGVCGGRVKWLSAASTWSDITGSFAPTAGQNNQVRFTQFQRGSSQFLIGTGANKTALWKWPGSGNIQAITDTSYPGYAVDVCECFGRLWMINTPNGAVLTEYTLDGDETQIDDYVIASAQSPGMGLTKHNDGTLLVFHEDSIHAIRLNFDSASPPFQRAVVDGSTGAHSTQSIITYQGATYFVGPDGIYRIKDPAYPAEYISYPIEEWWNGINQARVPYIVAVGRGEPWTSIAFLVSTGTNTGHNAVVAYNPRLDAWAIWESNSASALAFNCGIDFIDSNGRHLTLCGDYGGFVRSCWGHEENDTGNVDDGSNLQVAITTELKTGFMEMGYDGLKRIRQMWLDLEIEDDKTFTINLTGIAANPATSRTQVIGAEGARLSQTFIFGASRFASKNPTQAKILRSAKARLFQFSLAESDDGKPYQLNAVRFLYVPRGRRIQAYGAS